MMLALFVRDVTCGSEKGREWLEEEGKRRRRKEVEELLLLLCRGDLKD